MLETGNSPPPKTDTETIIVIEPDVIVRMVLADYLRECGYKVVECTNADEVLTILGSGQPISLVLSGAQMADGTEGFSLAHRIRVSHPNVKVILTTSLQKTADTATSLCNEGPLTKAFNPQEVVKRIRVLRERQRTSK